MSKENTISKENACPSTKERLIEAACEVFSEKGYHESTIADISSRCGCNIAAVNYHFGGKENLYACAWQRAFEISLEAYPPDGGLPEDAPAAEKLRVRIKSLIYRILDTGKVGHFSRMLFTELANPTNAIDSVIEQAVMPVRTKMRQIIAELLKEAATDENVCLCAACIMNMCSAFAVHSRLRKRLFSQEIGAAVDKTVLSEHIYAFAVGGIEQCRKKWIEEHIK